MSSRVLDEEPEKVFTDKHEIHVYRRNKQVKFYRRMIVAGTITRNKLPAFTLKQSEYDLYPLAWKALKRFMEAT